MNRANLGALSVSLALCLLGVSALFPASSRAASNDNKIELAGLFHDQCALFSNTNEPDSTTPIQLKLRAYKDDLTSASVKCFDVSTGASRFFPMTKSESSDSKIYDIWQGTIPASKSRKTYRIKVSDGGATAWYNARGAFEHEQLDGDFFIVPGFQTPDWLKNGIIYQIFPDRFYNGDTTNDVKDNQYKHGDIKVSRHEWGESPMPKAGEDRSFIFYGGDLKGVIDKLRYIRSTLGADVVYLNPIFKSPSNHKYDTSDYDVVDPAFGTNETLSELSSALHQPMNGKRGYLILDGVFNHTGDGHKWFGKYDAVPGVIGAYQSKQSPYFSYYTFSKWPKDYAHFMIFDSLPKLDFASNELRRAIYSGPNSVALKYLRSPYCIDGWRLDAPKYADKSGNDGSDSYNHGIWKAFRNSVKSVNPNSAIIGENWENANSWTANGEQWDSVTNFNAFTAPVSQWITGKSIDDKIHPISTTEFDRILRFTRADYPTNVQQVLSNHLSNHDISRFAERAGGDLNKVALGLIFQMTYIGTPTIYYGDEYGIMGGGDPDCRRTFDWSKGSSWNPLVSLTESLISLRKHYSALRNGSFLTLLADDSNKVFAFARVNPDAKIVVVLNNSAESKLVQVPMEQLEIPDTTSFSVTLSSQNYASNSSPPSPSEFSTHAVVQHGNLSIEIPASTGMVLMTGQSRSLDRKSSYKNWFDAVQY